MRLLLTLAVLMAGLLAGSYAVAPVPKDKPKTTADKLVGKWKLVKLPNGATPAGEVTFEFKKDGKVIICTTRRNRRDMPTVEEASYKVEQETIRFQSKQSHERKWSVIIKSMSDGEMVTADPSDKRSEEVLKRITVSERK